MQRSNTLLHELWRASLRKLSGLLARIAASIAALLLGASMVLGGALLILLGVLLVQQSLSKVLRFELSFGRALGMIARSFELLAHGAQ